MAKSENAKAFNAWKKVKETLQEAENWLVYANNLIATKPENETRWERKEVKKEEKRIEELKAKLVTLYTDEVKAEIEARENFAEKFAPVIGEIATKVTESEKVAFEKRKADINSFLDAIEDEIKALKEEGIFAQPQMTKVFRSMTEDERMERFGRRYIPNRITDGFDWEASYKDNYHAITWDLYKMNYRVVEYVGTITKLDDIVWTNNGLEGVVTGTDGRCYIRSILAGGYNIQCLHVRMIVNRLKGD